MHCRILEIGLFGISVATVSLDTSGACHLHGSCVKLPIVHLACILNIYFLVTGRAINKIYLWNKAEHVMMTEDSHFLIENTHLHSGEVIGSIPWISVISIDIKDNAWVTVNNDLWVTSEAIYFLWFSRVTKSRVKIIGEAHHELPKIVIHGNECIISHLTRDFMY